MSTPETNQQGLEAAGVPELLEELRAWQIVKAVGRVVYSAMAQFSEDVPAHQINQRDMPGPGPEPGLELAV